MDVAPITTWETRESIKNRQHNPRPPCVHCEMESFICSKYGYKHTPVDDEVGHVGRHIQMIAHIRQLSIAEFISSLLNVNGHIMPTSKLSPYDAALVEAAAARAGWSGKR